MCVKEHTQNLLSRYSSGFWTRFHHDFVNPRLGFLQHQCAAVQGSSNAGLAQRRVTPRMLKAASLNTPLPSSAYTTSHAKGRPACPECGTLTSAALQVLELHGHLPGLAAGRDEFSWNELQDMLHFYTYASVHLIASRGKRSQTPFCNARGPTLFFG